MNQKYELFFGRLGRFPELRRTQDGGFVCDFSVAINAEKDQPPVWKKVVVFGALAQKCSKHLKKGSEIFVRGRSKVKSFQTKGGITRTYEEVLAHLIGFTSL